MHKKGKKNKEAYVKPQMKVVYSEDGKRELPRSISSSCSCCGCCSGSTCYSCGCCGSGA
jgi:hypothetical protein